MAAEPPSRCAAPERLRRLRGPAAAAIHSIPRQQSPGRDGCNFARLAAHPSGLAFGLALAVRPAGLAESPGSTALRRRVPRSGTITRQISLFCTAQRALVEELVYVRNGGYLTRFRE
jgi:hypothetical protein